MNLLVLSFLNHTGMQNYQNHPLAGAKDLDSAMTKLWAFYKKYFVGLYIISLVTALLSNLISSSLDLEGLQAVTEPDEVFGALKEMAMPYTILMVVSLVMAIFIHAYVLEKPLGQDFSPLTMLKNSVVALLPYLLVMIILGLASGIVMMLGFVMLILPGLFALVYCGMILTFVLPVTLAESRNPGSIIERSFRLSHRNIWPNIGWFVVVILIILVISLVISGIVMLPFTGSFFKALANPEEASSMLELAKKPLYIGLSSVAGAFITPVFPILAFILYFRNWEDVDNDHMQPVGENKVTVEDLYPKMPEKE